MKKNSFIQGTIIASIAIIFVKILGALYVIPFYDIIGEQGGALYSYAYNILVTIIVFKIKDDYRKTKGHKDFCFICFIFLVNLIKICYIWIGDAYVLSHIWKQF